MNPFLTEYRRLQRYSLLLLLVISLLMTVMHYFLSLSDRLAHRQELLNSSSETLEQEIRPYQFLLNYLKTNAEIAFIEGAEQAKTPVNGIQLAQGATEGFRAFDDQTAAMLGQLNSGMQFAGRSLAGIKRIAYVSTEGLWYQIRTTNHVDDLMVKVWQDLAQKSFVQQNSNMLLHVFLSDSSLFALSVPVLQNGQRRGALVMEFDLAALLMVVSKSQPDKHFILLNDASEVMLASKQGKLVAAQVYDGAHQHDNLKSLQTLPLALNVQYESGSAFRVELANFVTLFAGYACALLALIAFQVRRFKTKVLAPFAKLMVHISRLSQGDQQGVRRVSEDWRELFRQIDDLVKPNSKVADE
jgi:hypothetical protein